MRAKRLHIFLGTAAGVLFVAGLNVGTAWAQAEATIRGQIVASADASALAGAPVTLQPAGSGEPLHTTADPAGRFVFLGVRPGEYTLSAAADGFAPRELRLVVEPREVRS